VQLIPVAVEASSNLVELRRRWLSGQPW